MTPLIPFNFMRIIYFITLLLISTSSLLNAARIKDITDIEGNRENQLVGYGLVIGLAGQGDSTALASTQQTLSNLMRQLKINVPPSSMNAKNVAAVIITANIGPFMKEGSKIDVTISSVGDAKSLQGGVLLQAPLMGADNAVYAVAQGPVAVGGFIGGGGGAGGSTVQQNHPTVGKITGGAIVEREIPTELLRYGSLNLLMANPDFTSAVRIADAINKVFPGTSLARNSATVNVIIPEDYKGQESNFIASIGQLDVTPDILARVVINERTGTIVATSNVRISTVAVSHGSLTISIANTQSVSQPGPLSQTGTTEKFSNTATNVNESKGAFRVVEEFPTIERLTSALNALGVTTREMISILQTIKSAGALQAELTLN